MVDFRGKYGRRGRLQYLFTIASPQVSARFWNGIGNEHLRHRHGVRPAYQRENKKRDEFMQGKTDEEVEAQYTDQELLDLGDRSPFYRYTV